MRPKKEILRGIEKAPTHADGQRRVDLATVELLADLRDAVKEKADAVVKALEELVKEQRQRF